MSTEDIPKILIQGIKFLKFLGQPYGIIPIAVKDCHKRPMVKVKGQLENLYREGDKDFLTNWNHADYYGLVTHPSFNPDIKRQLFVIDVDIPTDGGHSSDGREHLHELDITDTFTVQTPSGGIHYLYWAPLGHKFKHAPFPGIDLVWKSPFYFIGIGSPKYKLINKVPIAIASDDLLEQLKYVHEEKLNKDGDRATILDDIIDNGVPSGQRHNTILRLMASLVKRRIPKAEAMVIAEYAIGKCDQSSGLPTIEEAANQYKDAMAKFSIGSSFEELMKDLVYLSGPNVVKSSVNRSAPAISAAAMVNVYPAIIPNTNKPLNQQGNFPLGKLGQVWIDSADKLMAHTLGYRPCADDIFTRGHINYFNEYMTPNLPAVDNVDDLVVERFQRVFKRTFGPIYDDWLKVIKYKFLNPHVKFSWCIYLTSKEEGTGKGLSWAFTQAIFGAVNCLGINPSEINQRFNKPLSTCTFALVDEAHGVVNKSARNSYMNALKRIITEDTMTAEGKNVEKDIGVESYFFMSIFSNDRTALEIGKGSRRFLVYHDEEKKSDKEINMMNQVGSYIKDPTMVAMFLKWIIDNVDITINKDFNPKGEARKTDDLLNSDSDVYMSPDVQKVMVDIESKADIFQADLITWSQLEYYCFMEFGQKYTKVMTDLKSNSVIRQLRDPLTGKPKRINIERLDKTQARDGLEIQDAYMVGKKSQSPVYITRNLEHIESLNKEELGKLIHAETEKNGARKSGTKLAPVI